MGDQSAVIDDYETSINFLFNMALKKIVFLPYSYIMDRYRWDIFDGSVDSAHYNTHWWELRENIQGIKSPVERSKDHFDPGAKYHIPANVPYIRYFVSHVNLQKHKNCPGILGMNSIKWNSTKFLVNKSGVPVKRFGPKTEPFKAEDDIIALLKE